LISLDMVLTPGKFVKNATNFSLSRNAPQPDAAWPAVERYADERIQCHAPFLRNNQTRCAAYRRCHLLMETNQRGLPVVDCEGILVGVISEGDFLNRTELDISPPPGNWLEELLGIEEDTPARRRMRARLVREVMTRDPACVDDEASLDDVVALMDARHIAQLPVVCGGSVVGVVSRVELLAAVANVLGSVAQES
jgi:CBS domain-containing protein